MPFWNGEKLLQELPGLIEGFQKENIDCAAYTLTIGDEIYVSPSRQVTTDNEQAIRKLELHEAFVIPPGQFAFLLTHEKVAIPNDAIGFISMKARIKFRGLINVSGFHVDPGYFGRLIFAVFNAGPVPVQLRNRDQCFLIWYADLSGPSEMVKDSKPVTALSATETSNLIAGELHSFESLASRIKDVEKEYEKRTNSLEREASVYKVTSAVTLTLALAIFGIVVRDCDINSRDQGAIDRVVCTTERSCTMQPTSPWTTKNGAGPDAATKLQQQPSSPAAGSLSTPGKP